MRNTYAVILEIPPQKILPGMFAGLENLDPGNFRVRREISRVEVENFVSAQLPLIIEALRRYADSLFLPEMRRIVNDPELSEAAARQIGNVFFAEVPDCGQPVFAGAFYESQNSAVLCPECSAPMIRRNGSRGKPFYGCTKYPSCKGTRSISV